ncbi:MAG: SDR family oxidoreductase [Gammaproteobacteria bacterium]|nr:SDR family oxidoreductase [Gammaproteobacteria bacterium]
MSVTVAVTGASGFIGRALCAELYRMGVDVRRIVRDPSGFDRDVIVVEDISATPDWSEALYGVDVVVHTAARAHVLSETAQNPLAAFRATNTLGTRNLVKQAVASGVRRLVFLSSIGVLGSQTNGRMPFSAEDRPMPQEDYALSKWEAEQLLEDICRDTGLEAVTLRPPLVYGPGVRANFMRLVRLVQSGFPLPLGSVHNLRSLVGIDNLVDLLIRCIDHPNAAGETFLVSDGHDLSTADLIRGLAQAMNRPARLFPCPPSVLRMVGQATGRLDEVERLIGSLQVDIRHTCEALDWTPPVSVEEGLRRTVKPLLKGSK